MRNLLRLLLFLLVSIPAIADPPDEDVLRPRLEGSSRFFIDLGLGLNITWMDGNPFFRDTFDSFEGPTDLFQSASGLGPLISLGIGYEFNQHLSLLLRADYDVRNTSNSGTTIDSCFLTDPVGGGRLSVPFTASKEFNVDVSYISISLLPAYRFNQVFLYAGPSISIPLSRDVSETDQVTGDASCTYFSGTSDSSRVITGSLASDKNLKTRFSVKIGLGYVIGLTDNIDLVPQLAGDIGWTNTFAPDGSGAAGQGEPMSMINPQRSSVAGTQSQIVQVNDQIRLSSLQALLALRIHF